MERKKVKLKFQKLNWCCKRKSKCSRKKKKLDRET